MKKINSLLVCSILTLCFASISLGLAQEHPTSWQEQLDYAKNKFNKDINITTDINSLLLIDYVYKGKIDSDSLKAHILNLLTCDESPAILYLPPLIESDTIITENGYNIHERKFTRFEIITIKEAKELAKETGEEIDVLKVKENLKEIIEIGYEYIKINWEYKNKKFSSICIVSNDKGGIIYEPIGYYITSGVSTTIVTIE